MCLLIFVRISAATLRGRQTKSCNYTEILKAQKLKFSHPPSSNKIFYYFSPLGFGIAEYNYGPIVEIKIVRGVGGCPGKCTQIPENEVHCPGFILNNYGMYDFVNKYCSSWTLLGR